MTDKFQNKYRIPSIRLPNWDYRWEASYFVTICTHNRLCYFGNIVDGKMNLSNIGIVADIMWHEIKNHAKNVTLDAFVVMPNHIHGIITLHGNNDMGGNDNDTTTANVETGHALSNIDTFPNAPSINKTNIDNDGGNDDMGGNNNIGGGNDGGGHVVETGHALSLQRYQHIGGNSLSSIIGSYKSAVTKHIHRLGYEFTWQTRFYEHIIRDERSFDNIDNYIVNNPANWNKDKFYE